MLRHEGGGDFCRDAPCRLVKRRGAQRKATGGGGVQGTGIFTDPQRNKRKRAAVLFAVEFFKIKKSRAEVGHLLFSQGIIGKNQNRFSFSEAFHCRAIGFYRVDAAAIRRDRTRGAYQRDDNRRKEEGEGRGEELRNPKAYGETGLIPAIARAKRKEGKENHRVRIERKCAEGDCGTLPMKATAKIDDGTLRCLDVATVLRQKEPRHRAGAPKEKSGKTGRAVFLLSRRAEDVTVLYAEREKYEKKIKERFSDGRNFRILGYNSEQKRKRRRQKQ